MDHTIMVNEKVVTYLDYVVLLLVTPNRQLIKHVCV